MFKKIATWFRVRFGEQPQVLTDRQPVDHSIGNVFQKEVEAAERPQATGRYI